MKRIDLKIVAKVAMLACILAAGICGVPAHADKYQSNVTAAQEQQLDRARNLRRTPDGINESIGLFQQILKENPEYYLASYNLALAYADSRQYDKALPQFEHAAKLQEKYRIKDPTLFNSYGWAYLLAGNYDQSELTFKKAEAQFDALSHDSRRRLLNNIGVLYQYKKDFQKAEVYLTRAAEEFSSSVARENLRSNEMLQQQQQQQQQQKATRSIQMEQVQMRSTSSAR